MKDPDVLKNFIVLEGIDGAGTSTQLKALGEYFAEKNIPHELSCEPTESPIGVLIRQVLKGDLKIQSDSLAYLFSADRNEHIYGSEQGVLAKLKQNKLVISDRYFYSSLAYQSIKSDFDFIYSLNQYFPIPEHLFFLDISPEVGEERLSSRDDREIFELPEIQKKLRNHYLRSFEKVKNYGGKIHLLDGTAPKEEITANIKEILKI